MPSRSKHSGDSRLDMMPPSKPKKAVKAFDEGSAKGGSRKSAYSAKPSTKRNRDKVERIGGGFAAMIERRKRRIEEGTK